MPRVHRVRQGECLTRIASENGFASYHAIYDHPDNAELRRKRPDPNILHPGDRIVIPDKEERQVPCYTGRQHVFLARTATRKLKLRITDAAGEPVRETPYTLSLGSTEYAGTTDGKGLIEHTISVDAESGLLDIGGRTLTLRVAHLNPMKDVGDDVSGIQARLLNLGFYSGAVDGKMGPRTRDAIKSFQRHHELKEDGECSPELISAIKDIYGC